MANSTNEFAAGELSKARFAFPEKFALPEESLVKFLLAIVIGLLALRWLVVLQKETTVFTFGYGT
jgi:hypothetical protein